MYLLFVFLALLVNSSFSELTATLRTTDVPTTVNLELQNTGSYAIALLRWNLPLDQFGGENAFHVILVEEEREVNYLGARVKYADPTFYDYLVLAKEESVTVPVVLHNLYDFTKPGNYKVQFEYFAMDIVHEDDFGTIPRLRRNFTPSEIILSNPVLIKTEMTYPKELRVPYPCSNTEWNIIQNAASNLRPLITTATALVNQGNTPTYVEWFGAYNANRWGTAEEVLRYVQNNNVVDYACDDRAGVYAYVYPTDTTHTIYVCSAFWNAYPIGGWDTQAGTLLHELSHFNNIGATRDHAYGTGACRNLAINNPNNAVNNADSFEYFAESQF